jgi:hypothetical protein
MKAPHFSLLLSLALPVFALPSGAALPAAEPIGNKQEQLFADEFERADLGEWTAAIPTFTIQNGVLRGEQTRPDHGAVGHVKRPMKDVIVEFKFRLEGSSTFNAVFDDKNYKGSHAGHICRVTFSGKQILLGDDKEGIMRNDLFEMRKDPARKAEVAKQVAPRSASFPATIEQGKWHHALIELVGDRMRVSLDGQPVGLLQSPGLAHPTKNSFHFTVPGPGVLFDSVGIWKAQ